MGKATKRKGPGRPAGAASGSGREALVRAARDVLGETGAPGLTVRAVAERAGVQPALIAYYFGGRDGLLRAVVELVGGEVRERVEQAMARGGGVEECLRGLLDAWVDAMAAEPYGPRLMVEQILFGESEAIDAFVSEVARPNFDAIRRVLREGRATGEIRDVDPNLLIPSMAGMCVYFFLAAPILERMYGWKGMPPARVRRFAQHVGDLMMYGITNRERES